MPKFDRIAQNPAVLTGKPCIRGLRVSVGMIVSELAGGQTIEGILDDFPYLQREDILQALAYVTRCSDRRHSLPQTE